jgi:hypothetical protein
MAFSFQLLANVFVNAQDNSPYSRYGLGDLHPGSHIYNRGMGGITAAFSEPPSTESFDPRNGKSYSNINFSNPASYSRFLRQGIKFKKTTIRKNVARCGVNLTSHRLHEPNSTQTFTSTNAYFSICK